MALGHDISRSLKQAVGPVIGVCLVGYFAFHAINGHRGVRAWLHLRHDLEVTRQVADSVAKERAAWEHRVALLHPDSLDRDMLDERVRVMLNYSGDDDLVILTGHGNDPR